MDIMRKLQKLTSQDVTTVTFNTKKLSAWCLYLKPWFHVKIKLF